MGKQKGKSQRSKGNVRPSSSGRAASFLTETNALVGFEVMSGDLGYIPVLKSLEDDEDCSIDPHFKVALCKLSKRDITTKLKALLEFSALCTPENSDGAISVLPYWPRIYNRLVIDGDRRVREGVSNALYALVTTVGRSIAPHLKSIMGAWWMSTCDSFAPAASAANRAIQGAFPTEEKQRKALLFCQEQIFETLFSCMFQVSKSSDDVEKDSERIIASSLGALASYIKAITSGEVDSNSLANLVDNPRYWKFVKHKSPSVRSAFYCTLSAISETMPTVLEVKKDIALKSSLCRLNESNPLVSKSLWNSADKLTAAFDDWHEHIDIRKGFLPQFWGMIKSGFHGNARYICPFLLPLISRFPNSLAVVPVYQELFLCLDLAITCRTVVNSSSDTKAVITSVVECMQYILRKSVETCENPDWESADLVLKAQLLPTLEKSIKDKDFHNFLKAPLHQLISLMLASLSAKIEHSSTPKNLEKVCSTIWDHIVQIGIDVSDAASSDYKTNQYQLKSYIAFLAKIKETCYGRNPSSDKPTQRVKFNTDTTSPKVVVSDDCSVSNFILFKQLNTCIKTFLLHAMPLQLCQVSKLSLLSEVLCIFGSTSLYDCLVQDSAFPTIEDKQQTTNSSHKVLTNLILPSLEKYDDNISQTTAQMLATAIFSCVKNADNSISNFLQHFYGQPKQGRLCVNLGLLLVENPLHSDMPYLDWFKQDNCSFVSFLQGILEHRCNVDLSVSREWQLISSSIAKAKFSVLTLKDIELLFNTLEKTMSERNFDFENLLFCNNLIMDTIQKNFRVKEVCNCTSSLLRVTHMILHSIGDTMQGPEVMINQFASSIETFLQAAKDQAFLNNIVTEYLSFSAKEIGTMFCVKPQDFSVTGQLVQSFFNIYINVEMETELICRWALALLPQIDEISKLPPIEKESLDSALAVTGKRICPSIQGEIKAIDSVAYTRKLSYLLHVIGTAAQKFPSEDLLIKLTCAEIFQDLFLYSLFASESASLSGETGFWHYLQIEDFSNELCNKIVQNCLSLGGGWYNCLNKVMTMSVNGQERIGSKVQLLLITAEIPEMTFEIANTILAFAQACSEPVYLHRLVEWLANKFATKPVLLKDNKSPENNNFAFSIQCLVAVLLRIKELQKETVAGYGEIIALILENILQLRNSGFFLYDCELNGVADSLLLHNSAVASFLQLVVEEHLSLVERDHWDFLLCTAVSWPESVALTFEKCKEPKLNVLTLLCASCKLICALQNFLTSQAAVEDPTLPSSLTEEWKEYFQPTVHVNLAAIFILSLSSNVSRQECLVQSISKCLQNVSPDAITSSATRLKTYLYPDSTLNDSLQTVLHYLSQSFTDSAISQNVLLLCYNLLHKLAAILNYNEDGTVVNEVKVPECFVEVLRSVDSKVTLACESLQDDDPVVVQSALEEDQSDEDSDTDLRNEDLPAVQKPTENESQVLVIDEERSVVAYLMMWRLIIQGTNYIPPEQRSNYISSLTKDSATSLDRLLTNLWHVLPLCINKKMYESEQDLVTVAKDSRLVECLSCLLYKDTLMAMPVRMRTWFNGLGKLERARVDAYTTRNVSPFICHSELKSLNTPQQQQDLLVRARFATREVIARYEVAEAEFEISVQLSHNHPLSPVQVNTVKRVGVQAAQWRYWILQMTMLLQHQNGSIIDALLLWKQKVDRRLDGVEECMICFSVVHGGNAQSLPKLECKTCHKRYHAECLYKWFDTSNQSTCPLCRAPMMFK